MEIFTNISGVKTRCKVQASLGVKENPRASPKRPAPENSESTPPYGKVGGLPIGSIRTPLASESARMKDFMALWNSLLGRTYDAVNTNVPGHRKASEIPQEERDRVRKTRSQKYKRSGLVNTKLKLIYVRIYHKNISNRKHFSIVDCFSGALKLAALGIIGLISGLLVWRYDPYDLIYRWKLVFGEGGEIFELWRKPPVELYLKVYLWNVTNMDEYMSGEDDVLRIQDVGPYVYRMFDDRRRKVQSIYRERFRRAIPQNPSSELKMETENIRNVGDIFNILELLTHENVTFNDNGTLTAIPKHPLVWVEEMSEGRREDDLVILPNIALLSIADVVSDQSYFTRFGLNMLIRQTDSQPLVKMTAREFMFGYSSSLMTLGNKFMPSWIYFDKLGLIDRMYDFEGDYETIFTGEKHGLSNIGLIDTYRGSTKIPQWDSPCGDVTGSSDGTKFPGYIKENDTLLFFRKSMCRAKAMVKVGETYSNGFDSWVYHFDPEADDNGYVNEENKCFCKNRSRKCLPPGLLDVRECYYGFPIALSYPHFLDGDKVLSAKVNGMNPDPDKHRSYFVIEPNSGLPVELAVRYQINMALGSIKTIAHCERFNDMVLPLLWTEIVTLRFRMYLNILPVGEQIIMYTLLVGGAALLIYSLYKFVRARSDKNHFNAPWIQDELVYNIDRKLNSYIPERKGSGLGTTEVDLDLEGLACPLTQDVVTRYEV
ncbi:hypothetical protein NQ318_005737 [Aromia moschata]|uniref:Scavenger receptor class B member 1 n=1 Tax=Aromia moschata TaxID=1265417 RepID=A0AAV8YQC9_9CUCU|nr:hypothetical protein NQ318_005737 [Aromia moschata]